jgi:hypothetical protein
MTWNKKIVFRVISLLLFLSFNFYLFSLTVVFRSLLPNITCSCPVSCFFTHNPAPPFPFLYLYHVFLRWAIYFTLKMGGKYPSESSVPVYYRISRPDFVQKKAQWISSSPLTKIRVVGCVCVSHPLSIPQNNRNHHSATSRHISSHVQSRSQSENSACDKFLGVTSRSWPWEPIWGLRPDFYCQRIAGLLMWGALSDERMGPSFTIAAGPR